VPASRRTPRGYSGRRGVEGEVIPPRRDAESVCRAGSCAAGRAAAGGPRRAARIPVPGANTGPGLSLQYLFTSQMPLSELFGLPLGWPDERSPPPSSAPGWDTGSPEGGAPTAQRSAGRERSRQRNAEARRERSSPCPRVCVPSESGEKNTFAHTEEQSQTGGPGCVFRSLLCFTLFLRMSIPVPESNVRARLPSRSRG
jgi:hypothetical protein